MAKKQAAKPSGKKHDEADKFGFLTEGISEALNAAQAGLESFAAVDSVETISDTMLAEPPELEFLPEVSEEDLETELDPLAAEGSVEILEGSELEDFEAAEIEDVEFVEDERVDSIIESILFASDRPVSLNSIRLVFKGTNIKSEKIRRSLEKFAVELAGACRGVSLEQVPGGYQLRTKIDNMQFLTRTLKVRPFRLSGPALEVLSMVAYKQPIIKSEIDEIRGVESGHLLRALMEKNLVTFGEKSLLPGKPMQYETTKKFLEIFGLRNLQELPTLSQIDELLPEGITEDEVEKTSLSQLTDSMSTQTIGTYSQGEEELNKITEELSVITSSSEFFEQEKLKQKQKREEERAQNIREAILIGEEVTTRDRNWLSRFDEAAMLGQENPAAGFLEGAVSSEALQETVVEEEESSIEESLEANDLADIDGEGEEDHSGEANL